MVSLTVTKKNISEIKVNYLKLLILDFVWYKNEMTPLKPSLTQLFLMLWIQFALSIKPLIMSTLYLTPNTLIFLTKDWINLSIGTYLKTSRQHLPITRVLIQTFCSLMAKGKCKGMSDMTFILGLLLSIIVTTFMISKHPLKLELMNYCSTE